VYTVFLSVAALNFVIAGSFHSMSGFPEMGSYTYILIFSSTCQLVFGSFAIESPDNTVAMQQAYNFILNIQLYTKPSFLGLYSPLGGAS